MPLYHNVKVFFFKKKKEEKDSIKHSDGNFFLAVQYSHFTIGLCLLVVAGPRESVVLSLFRCLVQNFCLF
jgi:hypothetical protein